MLWTEDRSKTVRQAKGGFLSGFLSVVAGIFAFLFRGVKALFGLVFSLIARSKVAIAVTVIVVVALVGGIVDNAVNGDRIYSGVKVGEVDLGGKTTEEAQMLIEDAYAPDLTGVTVYIFANDDASKDLENSLRVTEDALSNEQLSLGEVRSHRLVWQTNATSLLATLDSTGLADDAYAAGRADGGPLRRLGALLFGYGIEPRASYDKKAFEALANDIDQSIGNPRVNYGISVAEGVATVTGGHDGYMLDRAAFQSELDHAFFNPEGTGPEEGQDAQGDGSAQASSAGPTGPYGTFVAHVEYAPLQITQDIAQQTCDKVNGAIGYGALFESEGATWSANGNDLGNWVGTAVEPAGGSWVLRPYLDYDKAKGIVLSHMKADYDGADVKVEFTIEDGKPFVNLETPGTIPLSEDAIKALSDYLFAEGSQVTAQPKVTVASVPIPDKLSFDEALGYGVITNISEYTTEYTTSASARNNNIHLAADLLNDSIIGGDGGTWSFNGIAGNCDEEAGFQGAGSIVDGEIVDEIGGGICQVATTVFNAVYEAGFPVEERHNHSLYIASYPEGRDAAVSWPDLDLEWENDSMSDVLLVMSYTDSTVTATLYGIDPEYQVGTEVGDWKEGEKFKTRTVEDDTLPVGMSYIKTPGVDGSVISVVRTVKDRDGNVLHEDLFLSQYDPKDEIKVVGPDTAETDQEAAAG